MRSSCSGRGGSFVKWSCPPPLSHTATEPQEVDTRIPHEAGSQSVQLVLRCCANAA
jgi:hypothetical protein